MDGDVTRWTLGNQISIGRRDQQKTKQNKEGDLVRSLGKQ